MRAWLQSVLNVSGIQGSISEMQASYFLRDQEAEGFIKGQEEEFGETRLTREDVLKITGGRLRWLCT